MMTKKQIEKRDKEAWARYQDLSPDAKAVIARVLLQRLSALLSFGRNSQDAIDLLENWEREIEKAEVESAKRAQREEVK